MTTGQRTPGPDVGGALRAAMAEAARRWQELVEPYRAAVLAIKLPQTLPRPVLGLVTAEDVQVAGQRYFDSDGPVAGVAAEAMRAALEAYGARLVARLGQTP